MSSLVVYPHPFGGLLEERFLEVHPVKVKGRMAVMCPPGTLLKHCRWPDSLGILLSNTDDSLIVLWTHRPGKIITLKDIK